MVPRVKALGLTRTLILDLVPVPFLTAVMLQMRNWEGHPFCRYHFEQLSNHITKVGFLFMTISDLEQENTHTGIYSLPWASQEEQFIVVKRYEILLAQFFMVTALERNRLKRCSSKNKITQILSGKRSVGEGVHLRWGSQGWWYQVEGRDLSHQCVLSVSRYCSLPLSLYPGLILSGLLEKKTPEFSYKFPFSSDTL